MHELRSSSLTLGFLALQAVDAEAIDESGLDIFVLGPLVKMLKRVIDLLLGRNEFSENSFHLVLVKILVNGICDLIDILVKQAPELLQLVTAELERLGVAGFEGPTAGFSSLRMDAARYKGY